MFALKNIIICRKSKHFLLRACIHKHFLVVMYLHKIVITFKKFSIFDCKIVKLAMARGYDPTPPSAPTFDFFGSITRCLEKNALSLAACFLINL